MRQRIVPLLLLVATWSLVACSSSSSPSEPDRPVWLTALIAEIQAQPATNPPSSIWRYRYHGEIVYYRPPVCCDVFGDLYDEEGNLICHPDGGIAGNGDGRCPDFFDVRTGETLIFRDPRG